MSITDKITGRVKKAAGDLMDDPSTRREGAREERKGEAKEERDRAHERADAKAQEVATSSGRPDLGDPAPRVRSAPRGGTAIAGAG